MIQTQNPNKTRLSKVYKSQKLTFEQNVDFRQENLERERVYRIYSPAISKEKKKEKTPCFKIDAFGLRENLMVSNLPLIEHARMQKYNIICSPSKYKAMARAPKYIFDSFHFNFEFNHHIFSKTHYYAIAPTLDNGNDKTLPVLYRFSVCRELGNPQHFSITLYAVIGGYEDGFYFISRLDNDRPACAHKIKTPCIKNAKTIKANRTKFKEAENISVIPFPHLHRPHFNADEYDEREYSRPIYLEKLKDKPFEKCLDAFLKIYNINPEMILTQDNCKISTVLDIAKTYHHKQITEFDKDDIFEKIALDEYITYNDCNVYEYKSNSCEVPNQKCGTPYLRY